MTRRDRWRVERALDFARRTRSMVALQAAADLVAARRPTRYHESTFAWWHLYYETREAIVAIVQSWGPP